MTSEYQRSDRVGDLLLDLISELLRREIRDPRIATVTLTAAKVSKDLRHARIFYNLLGGQADKETVSKGLESAAGFIRSRVGKQMTLRFVPTIEFCYDETEDKARRIDELLKHVKS